MEIKPIPWIKTEDFEFVDGEILLATHKSSFPLPHLVVVHGNKLGTLWESGIYQDAEYEFSDFDYYAAITNP